MKHYRRILALLMCLFVMPLPVQASQQLPVQSAHQVTLTQLGEKKPNGSEIYRWDVVTAQPTVSEELNALAKAYVEDVSPMVKKPAKDAISRLDVSTIFSLPMRYCSLTDSV